jgi:hypothetical protein
MIGRVAARVVGSVLAVGVAAAALAAGAVGALVVGVNDDGGRDPALASWLFPTLGAEGLQDDAITLRWDENAPTTVPNESQVERALELAAANGVTVELDLFPLHSQVFTGGARCASATDPEGCGSAAAIQQFAAWTAQVARTFATVHQFIVMNECNQPLFVNPQWDAGDQNQSAQLCGRALAAAYDALKAVSTQNFVWGLGLSPRGNDDPNASSNSSTSPALFLRDLGAWYRASGRTRRLMDGLDFHPYPVPQSLPFGQGYPNPVDAAVSNLPRVYQAFYDGFSGTAQPTIGQQAGGGLPVSLNEVGIQTDSGGRTGYVGTEVSANTAGGVTGQYATESYQSSWYLQMLNLVACDPNVRIANIYHLIDEASLAGWQSGLYYLDRSAKQSAADVHDWIANSAGVCPGAPQPWTPAGVSIAPAAPAVTPPAPSTIRIVAAANGALRIFDAVTHRLRRVLAPFGASYAGPLSVALGDLNGDHVPDFAVADRAGTVKLLNGKTGSLIATLSVRGSSVALGDVTGDGRADLVVGNGPGPPAQVKVFDGRTRRLLTTLVPFGASFRGGVSVAAGDVNGDGHADVIVGSGPGQPAQVQVFDGATGALLETLTPFGTSFTGGVAVAAGDVDGDGKADVIVGSGSGITAVVRVFRDATRTRLWSFDAFAPTFTGGVAVAVADLNHDGRADVVIGAGEGGGSQMKALDGKTHTALASVLAAPGSAALSVASG